MGATAADTGSFVGRQASVSEVLAALRAGRDLMISGPAGIGKTRLAIECARVLEADGWSIERFAATEAAAHLPLGAALDLVTRVTEPGAGASDLYWPVVRHLAAQAEQGPVLLVVDDIQHLDGLSCALFGQLIESGRVRVLATRRTGTQPPKAITESVVSHLDRIDLGPLDRAEARDFATTVAAMPIADATHEQIWEFARGNPLFIREMLVGGQESGILVKTEVGELEHTASLARSPRLVDLVEQRMARLDDIQRDAVDALALVERLPSPILETVASPAIWAPIEDNHMVVVEPGNVATPIVRLSHPLLAEARRSGMTPARHRTIAARLVEALAAHPGLVDIVQEAELQAACGRVDPTVCTNAAAEALRRSDAPTAQRLAERATTAGAGAEAESIRASALGARGNDRAARAAFRHLLADQTDERVVADLARSFTYYLFSRAGDADEAARVLADTRERLDDQDLSDELLVFQAELMHQMSTVESIRATVAPVLARGDAAPTTRARALVMGGLGEAWMGRPQNAFEWAEEGTSLLPLVRSDPTSAPLAYHLGAGYFYVSQWALLLLGRGNEAGHRAERYLAEHGDPGIVGAQLVITLDNVGWTHLIRGEIDRARALFERALDECDRSRSVLFLAPSLIYCRLAAALGGDLARCEELATRIEETPAPYRRAIGMVDRMADVACHCAAGDVAKAVDVARATMTDAPDRWTLHAWMEHELVLLGQGSADRLETIADAAPDLWIARAFADHARAVESGDGHELLAVAETFAGADLFLFAAEAAEESARCHHAHGHRGSALLASERADAFRSRCPGAVRRQLRPEFGADLTARQREIAGLASRGLANKEIAATLDLSVRTVENTLTRVYRALGISGRSGLT